MIAFHDLSEATVRRNRALFANFFQRELTTRYLAVLVVLFASGEPVRFAGRSTRTNCLISCFHKDDAS